MKLIGIIGAMEVEVASLKEMMTDVTIRTKASMEFNHGYLNGKEVVVVRSGIGKVNAGLVLDRKLSEKRIFPAIDIPKSGTRREDLLLTKEEQEAVDIMRRALNGMKSDEAVDSILNMFDRTKNNVEFVQMVKKTKFI